MAENTNPNLKNKVVFTQRRQVLGIPDRVFGASLLLVVFSAFVFVTYLGWVVGLPAGALLGAVIFVPEYLVHKDDPDAYLVWLGSLFAPVRLTASRISARPLVLLDWNGDRSSITPLVGKKGPQK